MELFGSTKDKFSKEIKERGPIIKSMSVETKGPKKTRSQKSHEQFSFQENHLWFPIPKEVYDEKDIV